MSGTRLWPNQKIQIGTATVELRRIKVESTPDMTVTPTGEVMRRVLPEAFLREKKYDIGGVVAQGGMGAILNAREATIERTVAMKVMLNTNSPDDLLRFLSEAKVTAQLEHPNIVPVHELNVDENGQVFYTMKMVKGITLKKVLDLLAQGVAATVKKYPLAALLTVYQKVCDALAFAHSKGVIHRDLKPENIMLGDYGEVLLMDWGLAKQTRKAEGGTRKAEAGAAPELSAVRVPGSALDATLAGTVMGTPHFMSPEQARGEVETLDARSDIYALGGILYQILSLRLPVTGTDAWEVVGKVGRGEIEPLENVTQRRRGAKKDKGSEAKASPSAPPRLCVTHLPNGRIPDSLAAVVRKAMALDPAQRYRTVADLQRDIEAYQNGFATGAEKAGKWKRFTLFVRRNKAASVGIAAVVVLSIGFMAKVIAEGRRAERGEAKANAALAELKASAPALLQLAESEAGFQRFDSALEKLDAALALDPALTAGWWRRAWLLIGMERYGEASAAFRTAQQRDPAQHAYDAFLPVIDAIAAAPDDTTRFPPGRTEAVFLHFTKVGTSGELNALSRRLTLGAKQKEQMVRQRLDEWLGKGVDVVRVQPDGTIEVTSLPKATDTLEPLRGLPIGSINLKDTAVKSIEALRGMHLTRIEFLRTRISDLSALRGMPITELFADQSDISDLTPLAGMPLRKFSASDAKITDLGPLKGAPLAEIYLTKNRVVDFSPLRGGPFKKVSIVATQCSDLSFLADSPALEHLDCDLNGIVDLTALRGKPLKILSLRGNRVIDLRPLAGLPLAELTIDGNPIADYSPLGELRQLQKLLISPLNQIKVSLEPLRQHPSLQYIAVGYNTPYRPVAEFWADYDAQQATGKK